MKAEFVFPDDGDRLLLKKKQTTLRMPNVLYEALRTMSKRTGIPIHSLILFALNIRAGVLYSTLQLPK